MASEYPSSVKILASFDPILFPVCNFMKRSAAIWVDELLSEASNRLILFCSVIDPVGQHQNMVYETIIKCMSTWYSCGNRKLFKLLKLLL